MTVLTDKPETSIIAYTMNLMDITSKGIILKIKDICQHFEHMQVDYTGTYVKQLISKNFPQLLVKLSRYSTQPNDKP